MAPAAGETQAPSEQTQALPAEAAGVTGARADRPPDAPTLPADFACERCGYPSGASGSVVCPECGCRATASAVESHTQRQETVRSWNGRGERAAVRRWLGVVVAYSLGAAVVGRRPMAVLAAPTVLAVAVGVSWQAGWIVERLTRADRRAYTRAVWRRFLWRLHLPWLVAPVFVVVAMLVGLIDLWGGDESGGVYWDAATAGFALWVIGCLPAFLAWWIGYLWEAACGRHGTGPDGQGPPRLTRADAAAFVIGAAVFCGTGGLGFAAGTLAANGVARWLGLHTIADEWFID